MLFRICFAIHSAWAGDTDAAFEQIDLKLDESVQQADQLNEELAEVIAQLRAQRGLRAVQPYTSATETRAEAAMAQASVRPPSLVREDAVFPEPPPPPPKPEKPPVVLPPKPEEVPLPPQSPLEAHPTE